MTRKSILLTLLITFVGLTFILHSTSVRANNGNKESETFTSKAITLARDAMKDGKIGSNVEMKIITDETQIRDALEKAGLDSGKGDMESISQNPSAHAGLFVPPCTGTANDLFTVATGLFGFAFVDVSNQAIGVCSGAGFCDGFPGCLVNAVCSIPPGQAAVGYGVAGAFTTDLGASCN